MICCHWNAAALSNCLLWLSAGARLALQRDAVRAWLGDPSNAEVPIPVLISLQSLENSPQLQGKAAGWELKELQKNGQKGQRGEARCSQEKFPIKGRVFIKKNPGICPVLRLHEMAHGRAAGLAMLPKQHCCLFTSNYFLKVIVSVRQPPWSLSTGGWFCLWTPKQPFSCSVPCATRRAEQPLQLMEREGESHHHLYCRGQQEKAKRKQKQTLGRPSKDFTW